MRFSSLKTGGTLLFVGGVQWFLGLLLAESWFSGYSGRIDYVSDLGIGPTALIYNISVMIMGICIVGSGYFLHGIHRVRLFTLFLSLTGIGAIGVGIFPASMQPMHSIFTLVAILFGALAAIASYKVLSAPLSFMSMILGVLSIGAVVLFIPWLGLPTGSTETFLGMAKGSMERWAIYPLLAWIIGIGGYLIGTGKADKI